MGPIADRVFVVIVLGGLTVWVIWGWRAWWRNRPQQLSVGAAFSLAGLLLASLSATLEIGSGTYAQFRDGGFPFNDPILLRIYFFGFWSALLALICSLVGVANKTPVRFKAPTLSIILPAIVDGASDVRVAVENRPSHVSTAGHIALWESINSSGVAVF